MLLLFGEGEERRGEEKLHILMIFGEYRFGRIRRDGIGEEEASWYYGGRDTLLHCRLRSDKRIN